MFRDPEREQMRKEQAGEHLRLQLQQLMILDLAIKGFQSPYVS